MSLSRPEVEKIALLGRLLLSEEEIKRMTVQLGDILGYMDLLGEVDTTNVEPMAHAQDVALRLRPDAVTEADAREALMANAPAAERGLFLVPKVIE